MSSDSEIEEKAKPSFDKSIRMAAESAKEAPEKGRISRPTRPPNRLDMDEKVNTSTLNWYPKPGPGMSLGSIARVREALKEYPTVKDPFLKDLHVLLYNRPGREIFRRRNVLRFSGFCEANNTADRDSNVNRALKLPLRIVRKLGQIFGLRLPNDRIKAAGALITFLENPQGEAVGGSAAKKKQRAADTQAPATSSAAEQELEGDITEDSDDEVGLLVRLAQPSIALAAPANPEVLASSASSPPADRASASRKRKREDRDEEDEENGEIEPKQSKKAVKKENAAEKDALAPPPAKRAGTRAAPAPEPEAAPVAVPRNVRSINKALLDFHKGFAGKPPARKPKLDLLIGYLYGRLGFKFAVDNLDLIEDLAYSHLKTYKTGAPALPDGHGSQ